MKNFLSLTMLALLSASAMAQKTLTVSVKNPSAAKESAPVVVQLKDCGFAVKSALVKEGDTEVPCQLDDLDKDGTNDELCFVTPIGKKQRRHSPSPSSPPVSHALIRHAYSTRCCCPTRR